MGASLRCLSQSAKLVELGPDGSFCEGATRIDEALANLKLGNDTVVAGIMACASQFPGEGQHLAPLLLRSPKDLSTHFHSSF